MSYLENTLTPAWRGLYARYAAQRAQGLAWFQRLSPRERRLVLGLATVVLAALVWLILIDPAVNTITSARQALPGLRTQAATVASLTERARGLKRSSAAHAAGTLPSEAELRTSLRQAGLQDAQWSLPAPAGDGKSVTVKFALAPAEPLLRWLDTAPNDWRLSVDNVELLRARDADQRRLPGKVNGTITLVPRVAGKN